MLVDETETSGNDDGDKTGIEVLQEGGGEGTLVVRASQIDDGIDAENVDIQK